MQPNQHTPQPIIFLKRELEAQLPPEKNAYEKNG